jgi:GntR family transcriptional regulator of vanillate catabolism
VTPVYFQILSHWMGLMTQLEQVIDLLREHILAGKFEPGTRLREEPLAEMLGTSRTPVRLALGALEQEQLVIAEGPRRGFRVATFTLQEVFEAIEARGILEGLAARVCAERGISRSAMTALRACLDCGRELLARGIDDDYTGEAWAKNNAAFHATIVSASGNETVAAVIEGMNRIPLTGPSSVILRTRDRAADLKRLQRAQDDHADIVEAIEARKGLRAEMLMREHSLLNIRNKLANFEELKARQAAGILPGLDLVVSELPVSTSTGGRARIPGREHNERQ